jgi:hypothetical protein
LLSELFISKSVIFEKHGLGKFELNIWRGDKPIQHYFTIEMASVHMMPVTVYYFALGTNVKEDCGTAHPVTWTRSTSWRAVFFDGIIVFAQQAP